jgi:hypothetical protein
MDISTIISVVEGAFRLAVDAPVLAAGIVIGAVGYSFALKRWPTLTANLVAKATDEVQVLVQDALIKATNQKVAAASVAQTTAAVQDKSTPRSK